MLGRHFLRLCVALAFTFAFAFIGPQAIAQAQKVTIALPTKSVGFAYAYIAESLGLWKEEGLDVTVSTITGLNATNALQAGNVEFSGGSGGTLLLATSRGRKLVSIANLHNRLLVEMVPSNDAIAKTGLLKKARLLDARWVRS